MNLSNKWMKLFINRGKPVTITRMAFSPPCDPYKQYSNYLLLLLLEAPFNK